MRHKNGIRPHMNHLNFDHFLSNNDLSNIHNTYWNWELSREVGGRIPVAAGEKGVRIRQGAIPNAWKIFAISRTKVKILILKREFNQIINVVKEAATIYLIHYIWPHLYFLEFFSTLKNYYLQKLTQNH